MEKQVLSPADVAPLLGVSKSRVYQLIADGVMPAVRVGGALKIPRNAWETWLETQGMQALRHVGIESGQEKVRRLARAAPSRKRPPHPLWKEKGGTTQAHSEKDTRANE